MQLLKKTYELITAFHNSKNACMELPLSLSESWTVHRVEIFPFSDAIFFIKKGHCKHICLIFALDSADVDDDLKHFAGIRIIKIFFMDSQIWQGGHI